MTMQFNYVRKLSNEALLQFALPKGGRGLVRGNGDFEIVKDLSVKKYGYFKEQLIRDSVSYLFVYKVDDFDIEEKISVCDEELSEDLLAFAIKLGYFFDKHPDYKYTSDHDLDVLERHSFAEGVGAKNTPLAKAGLKIV